MKLLRIALRMTDMFFYDNDDDEGEDVDDDDKESQ